MSVIRIITGLLVAGTFVAAELSASAALSALAVTAILALFVIRSCRSRRPIGVLLAVIGIAAVHWAGFRMAGPHMRGYLYRASRPEATFLEVPYVGHSYEITLQDYQRDGGGAELYRTFQKQWWNYYRWLDYITHPRWRLPYQAG